MKKGFQSRDLSDVKHVYEVVPATLEHAKHIARNARDADRREVWAVAHKTCFHAMVQGLMLTDKPLTGMIDGEPVCMFGISLRSAAHNSGIPWMIGTKQLDSHRLAFARRCKLAFYPLAAKFAELENYVDARNTAAIRWLRWLGFDFDKPAPYGIEGRMFQRFYMRA